MTIGDTWYRYHSFTEQDEYSPNKQHSISFGEYSVISETDKTVLLVTSRYADYKPDIPDWVKRHRVLKVARKRFAYPTKALAFNSFRIRKEWQLRRLGYELDNVRTIMAATAFVKGLLFS